MKKRHHISPERRHQLAELVERLAVPCADLELLDNATTHKSFASENEACDYERLEFFGDAVLKFVVAEYLFATYPEMHEGELTEISAVLISAKTLEEVGNELGIADFIRTGKGVPVRGSLVARATEAVLGALYMDSQFAHARPFIIEHICSRAETVANDAVKDNYKAQLQQYSQARAQGTPVYSVVKVDGPAHDPIFEVAVSIGSKVVAQGSGRSKKVAEQSAAKIAFEKLNTG